MASATITHEERAFGDDADERILEQQVRLLYARGTAAYLASAFSALVVAYTFRERADGNALAAWLAAVAVLSVVRFCVTARYFTHPERKSARAWARWFTALAGLNGVVWGSLALIAWSTGSLISQVLVAIIVVGMASGSAALCTSYLPAFFAFAVPAVLPALVRLAAGPSRVQHGVAVLLVVFALFITQIARAGARTLVASAGMRVRLEELNRTLERRVAARTSELAAALRGRDEFLTVASHELRTPVTSLKLQLQLLARELPGSVPAAATRLGVIRRQINRLAGLINTLLDVAAIGEGRLALAPRAIDLAEVIRHVGAALEGDLKLRGCALQLELADGVMAELDPERVEQVVTNLILNAAKYGANAPITVSLGGDADTATIAVRDQGMGIPPEALERIFGRYERLAASRHEGGLGLGLFVVAQLVQAMGGRVWATSEMGRGATFFVRLPRRQQ